MDIDKIAELIIAGETSIDIENELRIDINYESAGEDYWMWITLADVSADDYIIVDTIDTEDMTEDNIVVALEALYDRNEDYFY